MKPYQLVPLKYLLSKMDESDIAVRLDSFVCTRDSDREDFLHNKAMIFEKKSMARTYLALIDDNIAGYFTLSIRCLRVTDPTEDEPPINQMVQIT